jgi:hypothetical protein
VFVDSLITVRTSKMYDDCYKLEEIHEEIISL